MIKICFLIRQLNEGGAQRQMIELVKSLDKTIYDISVLTFYPGGRFSPELEQLPGVRLVQLNKGGRWDLLGFAARMITRLRRLQPDLIHGYLATPNLLTIAARVLFPRARIVWGIRASYMDLSRYDWLSRLIYQLERVAAPLADLIIVNSEAARDYHVSRGFPKKKTIVIPNGFDTDWFRPSLEERERIRAEWQVQEGEKLIGLVGRLDAMKDHPTFLKAAALLTRARNDVRFVCIGDGPAEYRKQLQMLCHELGIESKIIWAGARVDVAAIYSAMDVATSSSYGESFPNTIAEAMATGVPCVVTAVGDSPRIVGDTGIVVPPRDPRALAAGWETMIQRLEDDHQSMTMMVRTRIVSKYGRDRLAQRASDAFMALL